MASRVNLTEAMLDVINSAVSSVEAGGEDHEAVFSLPEDEKAAFWHNLGRVNAWLTQEYQKRRK